MTELTAGEFRKCPPVRYAAVQAPATREQMDALTFGDLVPVDFPDTFTALAAIRDGIELWFYDDDWHTQRRGTIGPEDWVVFDHKNGQTFGVRRDDFAEMLEGAGS